MTAFVDSSVWFASVFTKDRHNKQAKTILGSKEGFVTTDAVLVETWLLLARRRRRSLLGRHPSKHRGY